MVALQGELSNKYQVCNGIYNLSSSLLNGKPFWLQEFGSQAIWFDNTYKNWKIGNISYLGMANGAKLLTHRGTAANALPNEISPWKYFENGTWVASNDVIVIDTASEKGNCGSKLLHLAFFL